MGLFNQFPFTNFHEMNLDWIINEINTLKKITSASAPDYVVTPEMFDAKSDGISDDYEAFIKMFDFASKNGKLVFIPNNHYLIDKPIFTDSNLIYKNSGIYDKYSISYYSKETILDKYFEMVFTEYKTNYITNGENLSIQSIEYCDNIDKFVLGFSYFNVVPGTNETVLAVCDSNFNIENTYNINAGHCNDMAFNPDDNKLYIACCGTGINKNSVVVVNTISFEIEKIIDFASPCYAIAYDDIQKCICANIGNNLCFIKNYNIDMQYTTNLPNTFNGEVYTVQSMFIYNGQYYYVCSGHYKTLIFQYDIYKNEYDYYMTSGGVSIEAECGCIKDDCLYIISGQSTMRIQKYYLKNNGTQPYSSFVNTGITITSTIDDMLKLCKIPGKYNINNSAIISSANAPAISSSDGSCTLFVIMSATDRNLCIMYTNNNRIFITNWGYFMNKLTWKEVTMV